MGFEQDGHPLISHFVPLEAGTVWQRILAIACSLLDQHRQAARQVGDGCHIDRLFPEFEQHGIRKTRQSHAPTIPDERRKLERIGRRGALGSFGGRKKTSAMEGLRRPYQRAASSKSQSTSGCFSSKCIGDPAVHPVEILVIHRLGEFGIGTQFVGPAQHFPPGGLSEFRPQQLRLMLVEPVGELASLL